MSAPRDEQSGAVTTEEFDLDELLGRAYVNWSPHPWVSLKGEYQYEKFKRPDGYIHNDLLYRLETHRLLFGINFFHPTGLFAELIPTYVYQKGDFFVFDPFYIPYIEPGSDNFWVFDASIGFRIPKRNGIFTIEAKNLFDKKFKFQDTDPANPSISFKRLILAKLTLAF